MSSFKDLSIDYYLCDDIIDEEEWRNITRPFPGYDVDEILGNVYFGVSCCKECENTMKNNEKHDNVNHPSHYTNGGIECIDAIKASMSPYEFRGYLKGNAIKYLWRYRLKGHAKEDLKKAQWYLNRLIEDLD